MRRRGAGNRCTFSLQESSAKMRSIADAFFLLRATALMKTPNSKHDNFRIRNARRWSPGGWLPYAGALATVSLAFLIRFELHPVLQSDYPFLLFTVAALLVEFFLGLGPALLVVVAGLLLGTYFFAPPYDSFLVPEPLDLFFVAGYLLVALLAIFLLEDLQRSRYALSLMKEVLQSRLEMLERSNTGRMLAERAAQENSERFRSLAASFPQILYMRRVDGEFEYLNEQFYRYTGVAPGALGAAGWMLAVHPEDTTLVTELCDRVGSSGVAETLKLRLRMADGSYEQFAGPLTRLEGKHGKDIKWVGSVVTPRAS